MLAATRHSGENWRRVVAIFQPNRYNRIAEIWQEYGTAFGELPRFASVTADAESTITSPSMTKTITTAMIPYQTPAGAPNDSRVERTPGDFGRTRGERVRRCGDAS